MTTTETGHRSEPYMAPPPPDRVARCAICRAPLTPPPGISAGLCVALRCVKLGTLLAVDQNIATSRVRAYNFILLELINGRLKATVDPVTRCVWLTQTPPKPAHKGVDLVQDDGSPTYRDWDSSLVEGNDDGK